MADISKISIPGSDTPYDLKDAGSRAIMANTYSASTTYNAGAYCIYNNGLWRCLVSCTGVTPVEGTNWTSVVISTELSGKIAAAQGSENANKVFATDANGNQTLIQTVNATVTSVGNASGVSF